MARKELIEEVCKVVMKSKMQVFNKFLAFHCLTNKLLLPMLLSKQSSLLLCLKEWDDVVGFDGIQGTGRASSQIGM